jgi:hypothetical protein
MRGTVEPNERLKQVRAMCLGRTTCASDFNVNTDVIARLAAFAKAPARP